MTSVSYKVGNEVVTSWREAVSLSKILGVKMETIYTPIVEEERPNQIRLLEVRWYFRKKRLKKLTEKEEK